MVWRYRPSAIDALARKPIAEIAVDEIERLRGSRPARNRSAALAEFTAALVHRHHAYDIELIDTIGSAAATDIEVAG